VDYCLITIMFNKMIDMIDVLHTLHTHIHTHIHTHTHICTHTHLPAIVCKSLPHILATSNFTRTSPGCSDCWDGMGRLSVHIHTHPHTHIYTQVYAHTRTLTTTKIGHTYTHTHKVIEHLYMHNIDTYTRVY